MKFSSPIVCVERENIDTDQIIPARFLKVTDKAGIGEHLFEDRPDFRVTKGSDVLVAGGNFGRVEAVIVNLALITDLLLLLHQPNTAATGEPSIRSVMHPVQFVPDSTLIEDVMVQMQRRHHNLAIVIDESNTIPLSTGLCSPAAANQRGHSSWR